MKALKRAKWAGAAWLLLAATVPATAASSAIFLHPYGIGAVPAGAVQPAQAPARSGAFFPPDEAVREFVRPYIDKRQAKGIVVGLVEPDGSRRVLTFGVAGEGARPLAASSVFEIGSITKTFTGTVLADMVRRGRAAGHRAEDPGADGPVPTAGRACHPRDRLPADDLADEPFDGREPDDRRADRRRRHGHFLALDAREDARCGRRSLALTMH